MIYQIGYGIGDRTKENSRIAQRIAWQINSDFRELKAGAEPQEITAGELVANAASRFHPEDKFDAPITKFIPEGHGEKLAREFELVEADGASTVIKITVGDQSASIFWRAK